MKRTYLIMLLFILAFPAFAQQEKALKAGGQAVVHGSEMAGAITRQMATQAMSRSAAALRSAQIVNLSGKPTLKIRLENPRPVSQAKLLPVHLLTPQKMRDLVFSREGLFIPEIIDAEEWTWFRGMQLKNLAELENVVKNGLELSKSHYEGKIHTTPALNIALGYTFPSRYSSVAEEDEKIIPVLVTIPYTRELEEEHAFYEDGFQYVFEKDVPTKYMRDILVFWSADGEPGWYKVTFENNELIFTPVRGKLQGLEFGN